MPNKEILYQRDYSELETYNPDSYKLGFSQYQDDQLAHEMTAQPYQEEQSPIPHF